MTEKTLEDIIKDDKKKFTKHKTKKPGDKKPFRKGKNGMRDKARPKRIQKGPRRFVRPTIERRNKRETYRRPWKRDYHRSPPRRQRPENLRERLEYRREEVPRKEPQAKLFVDNLPMKFTSEELNELFSEVGYLTKCKLVLDDFGKSKGRAVVMYENERDAERAIDKFHENNLDGKIISVEFAPGKGRQVAPRNRFNGHDSRIERSGFRGERNGRWRDSRRY